MLVPRLISRKECLNFPAPDPGPGWCLAPAAAGAVMGWGFFVGGVLLFF